MFSLKFLLVDIMYYYVSIIPFHITQMSNEPARTDMIVDDGMLGNSVVPNE